MELEIWAQRINRHGGKFYSITSLSSTSMSAPSSLHTFMTPANTQGVNVAVVTAPDIEKTLLTKEEQAQRDADVIHDLTPITLLHLLSHIPAAFHMPFLPPCRTGYRVNCYPL